MLVLSRRIGETITIGDEVTITVLGVKGNQVRIGVNAPKEVAVHREEIYQRIKDSERIASVTSDRCKLVPARPTTSSFKKVLTTKRLV